MAAFFTLHSAQVCQIHLTLSEFDKRTVELVPGQISISAPLTLLQYLVDESLVTLEYVDQGNNIIIYVGVVMSISNPGIDATIKYNKQHVK